MEWPEEGPDKFFQIDRIRRGWGSAILSGGKFS